tara:strand:- start:15090 stop:15566 length:477 start_codon:yes stop_codon:yes gene_type:complete
MPTPTTAQRHKLNRDPVADPHLILLEFQEDGKSFVHRAAINTEDVEWNGETYSRAAISVQLPQTADGETSAQLVASNIDRILGRAINAATQRINVRLILIDFAAPDAAIIDTRNLLVIPSASGSATQVTAQLAPRASLLEPVPSKQTTKAEFPGIWLA